MSVEMSSVSHFELSYGLSDKVINDVVEKCHLIFNLDDAMIFCQIWSHETAVLICNLVNEIFGDTYFYEIELDSE